MNNNLRTILGLIYFCIISSNLFAGTDGQIRGRVSNMEGEGLVGSQVYIEKLGLGAVADQDGNYIIINKIFNSSQKFFFRNLVICPPSCNVFNPVWNLGFFLGKRVWNEYT